MNKTSDRDAEALLRGAAFPDSAPKEALPRKLFFDGAALDLDDLALVAGGLNLPFVPPEAWPDRE